MRRKVTLAVTLAALAQPAKSEETDLHNKAKNIGAGIVNGIGGLIAGAGSAIAGGVQSGVDSLKSQFTSPPPVPPMTPPLAPPPSPGLPPLVPAPCSPPPLIPPSLPPFSPPHPPSPPMPPMSPISTGPPMWVAIVGVGVSLCILTVAVFMLWRGGSLRNGASRGSGQELSATPGCCGGESSTTYAGAPKTPPKRGRQNREQAKQQARARNPTTFASLDALASANQQPAYNPPPLSALPAEPGSAREALREHVV